MFYDLKKMNIQYLKRDRLHGKPNLTIRNYDGKGKRNKEEQKNNENSNLDLDLYFDLDII
jgi:hypothetical protein